MKHLSKIGIGCTGTMKANMLQDCPVPKKAEVKKQPKGYYEGFVERNSGVEVVVWSDNGPVTIGSNFESAEPVGTARRWSKEDVQYVNVPRPALLQAYNECMGGTDQMDQAISVYRPIIRNRKWY